MRPRAAQSPQSPKHTKKKKEMPPWPWVSLPPHHHLLVANGLAAGPEPRAGGDPVNGAAPGPNEAERRASPPSSRASGGPGGGKRSGRVCSSSVEQVVGAEGSRAAGSSMHPNPGVHGTLACSSREQVVFHTHERSAGGEGESAWAASRARENARDRPRVQDQHPALLLGQQSEVNNKKSVNITTEVKSKISGCAPPATPAGLPGPRRAGRRGAAPGPAPAGRPAGCRRSR